MALEIEVDLGVELESTATITEAGLSVEVTFGQVVTIDSALSATSTNPVQNKVIKEAIDDLAASTIVYPAASFEVIQGGTVTGDITDAQTANDGNTLRVNEAAGGLTVDFTFSDVEAFNVISLHLRYVGGANHQWEMQLWNYLTSTWDVKEETEGTQDYLTWFNISVPQDDAYISDGAVKVRFYHLPNFITSHYVLFDYVAVIASLSAANPLHNQLDGRTEANAHPATAITFAIEEITGADTLTAADSGKHFYSTAAADIDVTIDSGLTHPISIFQKGAGVVTIIAGSGTPTLLGDVKTNGQNTAIAIVPESTTVYEVIGGVE
jgi:hypothetical protein